MARIAIFDSGVGGLTIYSELAQQVQGHQLIFFSDNQGHPYGTKDEIHLMERVGLVIERFHQAYQPDLLVVACNTASTVCLPVLRERYDFPIVGVVPAIKPAAALSLTKKIGVLATPGTIARSYTRDLISDHASDCETITVGSSQMVSLAESKLLGNDIQTAQIRSEIEPFLVHKNMDVLVLACTHFPLLIKEIKGIFKDNNHAITLLDSATAIAKRVRYLIEEGGLGASSDSSSMAVFTESVDQNYHFCQRLQDFGLTRRALLSL